MNAESWKDTQEMFGDKATVHPHPDTLPKGADWRRVTIMSNVLPEDMIMYVLQEGGILYNEEQPSSPGTPALNLLDGGIKTFYPRMHTTAIRLEDMNAPASSINLLV